LDKYIFVEENGFYQINCSAAVWATDQIHHEYKKTQSALCDIDWIAESDDYIYLIEYKNATIETAVNPEAFQLKSDKLRHKIVSKFYDSLHYLQIERKNKPVKFVFIVEALKAGETERKFFRNKVAQKLPFELQKSKPGKIIDDFVVVSIAEWNAHEEYSKFPLIMLK